MHLVAPDHIGYGFSDMPQVDEFEYSFENMTTFELGLIDQLGADYKAGKISQQDYERQVAELK